MISRNLKEKEIISSFCLLMLGIAVFLFGFLFYPLAMKLIEEWRGDPEFSHGFLIPVVTVYLLWTQREETRSAIRQNKEGGILFVPGFFFLTGLLIFAFGTFLQHLFIQGIGAVAVLLGTVYVLFGRQTFKSTFFPILFLVFMLPIPHAVNLFFADNLKYFIADASGFLLGMAQVPVFLEGNMIHLASISLEVVEACSGLQTILSFLAIGSLFAYMGYHSNVRRIAFILLAIPMGIIANVLRVAAIGFLSYFFNNDVAHLFHHYAWTLIVGIGVIGFYFVDRFIFRLMVPAEG